MIGREIDSRRSQCEFNQFMGVQLIANLKRFWLGCFDDFFSSPRRAINLNKPRKRAATSKAEREGESQPMWFCPCWEASRLRFSSRVPTTVIAPNPSTCSQSSLLFSRLPLRHRTHHLRLLYRTGFGIFNYSYFTFYAIASMRLFTRDAIYRRLASPRRCCLSPEVSGWF